MTTEPAAERRFEGLASPYCRHLQSKKLCFRTAPPERDEDILDASRHCWCRTTQQILGPDGDVTSPDACRAGRGCFEAFL